MIWILSIGLAFVAFILMLGLYSRRGEATRDPPGSRSAAVFRATEPTPRPAGDDEKLSSRPGLGLAQAFAEALGVADQEVSALGFDAPFWEVSWEHQGEQYTLGLVLMEADRWLLRVITLSGAPAPPDVLAEVNAMLKRLPIVHDLTWHRRERALAGDLADGRADPAST